MATTVADMNVMVFIVLLYVFNESCRVTGNYRHGRHVFSYHAVRTYDGAVADSYSGQNRRVDADPRFVLYDDRFAVGGTSVFGVRIVVDGDQVYFRSYKDTVAYGYAATPEKGAAFWMKQSSPMRTGLP